MLYVFCARKGQNGNIPSLYAITLHSASTQIIMSVFRGKGESFERIYSHFIAVSKGRFAFHQYVFEWMCSHYTPRR